jgi:hypothetical protein
MVSERRAGISWNLINVELKNRFLFFSIMSYFPKSVDLVSVSVRN